MNFFFMFDEIKPTAKCIMQGFWVISHHRKPAALGRPIFTKGGNDHMSTWSDSSHNLFDIGLAVCRVG